MAGLFRQIGHWLFPRTCELCGAGPPDWSYLCRSCREGFAKLEKPLCFRCGEPMDGSVADVKDCPHCREGGHHFDFARASSVNEGAARDLVLKLKYEHKIHLGRVLAGCMAGLWEEYEDVLGHGEWLLVPVPLHPSKRRKRGYNQAEEIAAGLSRLTGYRLVHALKRGKDKRSQTLLTRNERLKRVHGLYALRPRTKQSGILNGKNVLLIDDVLTSGGTAEACAKELKCGGAATVGVLTMLRSRMRRADKDT